MFVEGVENGAEESQWIKIEKKLQSISKLLESKLRDSTEDLVINMYIQTSYCCL